MNGTSEYSLTIVVPVFNEKDNIHNLEKALTAFLPSCKVKACILFVDDGSTDGSLPLISEVCARHKEMFYISFAKNAGLSAAIKAGFDSAFSEYVGYMDADLQTTPEDFNLLLDGMKSHTLMTGYRANRKDTAFKRIQSKIANGFRNMMTHDGAKDTGCPLKIIRTDAAKRIPMFKGMHRFLPALVLLQNGASFGQVPVRHFPRKAGKSKFHLWNRLWGPFADCFAYRWMKPRYINYSIGKSNLSGGEANNKPIN